MDEALFYVLAVLLSGSLMARHYAQKAEGTQRLVLPLTLAFFGALVLMLVYGAITQGAGGGQRAAIMGGP